MRKVLSVLLCVTLCLFSLNGCAEEPSHAPDFLAVASIYPVYITLLNLTDGIEGVEAQLMAEPTTGCLHDYTLLPGDMKKLERADLFVVNGAGMESFLSRVVQGIPGLPILDASEDIALLSSEHSHEEESDLHEEEDAHDHENNPHVWTSVTRYMIQVKTIADGLCAANPQHAQRYRDNRDAYLEKLAALDGEMTEALSGLPTLHIVTFHEAFEYLAEDFGITVEAVIENEPDESPSPRRLTELVDLVRTHNIAALFVEPQYNNASAKIVAQETGCMMLTLDPVVTGARDKDAYLTGMRKNLQALLTAASG